MALDGVFNVAHRLDKGLKNRLNSPGDFGGVHLHGGLSLMECLTPWLVVRKLADKH